jgi:hypothetical protein
MNNDPHIGLNTVPEHCGFKQEVGFNEVYPLERAATKSTETDSKFGYMVAVCCNPSYIGITPEMRSARRFDEESGLVE